MGSAIATNLMRAGYDVIGYDLLAVRRRRHVRAGGRAADSAVGAGHHADVVICSLPSSKALQQVAKELATASRVPRIIIETSTLPIEVKESARERLAARGATLLDCPLSGTGAQARVKDVVVYASGNRAAYRRAVPVLEGFARAHYYVGPFGAGSKTKFVANLLVAIHNVAAAEALVLAMKAGLDPSLTLKVVGAGVGSSRVLQVRGPMMVRGDYSKPMATLAVFKKDLEIIGKFSRALGSWTPLFITSRPIYAEALAQGRDQEDTASVCAVVERRAKYRRRHT
jgi:3-hydroxyisobutyrate dehydrogenase-like beta-hydroxyacid dehydrogenase